MAASLFSDLLNQFSLSNFIVNAEHADECTNVNNILPASGSSYFVSV